MDKKTNKLLYCIAVLSVLVIVLGGFIFYDKVLTRSEPVSINIDKNSKTGSNSTTNNDNSKANNNSVDMPKELKLESIKENSDKYEKWYDYLLKQNINEITISICEKEDGCDPAELSCPKPKVISKEQLTKVLEEMTKLKLIKHLDSLGFGGSCFEGINVKYGDKSFNLSYVRDEMFINSDDDNLMTLLDKESFEARANINSGLYEVNFAYQWASYNSFIKELIIY